MMPTDAEHLAVAKRNQNLIDHLLPDIGRFGEWITVIAFYKALHVVEAVFFRDHPANHGRNHETREHLLKTTPRYQQIYRFYRKLWAASTVARYLEDQSSGAEYKSFDDYLAPNLVQSLILNHYLRQIEQSASRYLPPPSP
jgi:hypothetical protein